MMPFGEEAVLSEMSIRDGVFERLHRRVFYGWVILGVAGLGIFVSGPGQSHNFSVFIGPISEDLGISKATIATAYGLATLAAAFLLPKMGMLVDRFGPRLVAITVTVLLGFACMIFGAVSGFLWLALGFGILRFLGQGSMMLTSANMVTQWFQRKRGFALSLMALGFAVSMAVHPPLGQFLIETIGWRRAWLVLGLMTWVLMLPALLLLAFDKPEDKGLTPDGDGAADPSAPKAEITGLTLKEALRTRTFHIVAGGFFSVSMMVTVLHFYQVTIFASHGLAPGIAAYAFPISALTMVLTMPLVGRLFDMMKTRRAFGIGLLVLTAALVLSTFTTDLFTTALYAVAFGLSNAFSLTMFGYLWPRYFGRRHVGSIQGAGQMIAVVGASVGPFPVGIAFDRLGSGDGAILAMALIPFAFAIATQTLRTPPGLSDHAHLD